MGMGRAPRRRASPPAAAVPSLLLFAVLFVGRAAAAFGDPQGAGATALSKHASFFDRNGDGVVSFEETYGAFRALGFGFGMSSFSAAFINGALGSKCRPLLTCTKALVAEREEVRRRVESSGEVTWWRVESSGGKARRRTSPGGTREGGGASGCCAGGGETTEPIFSCPSVGPT